MNSNILRGTLGADPKQARGRHIPQIQWKCPQQYTLDPNWYVASGEESTEAVTQRERQRRGPTDPRPTARACKGSENCDSKTPVISLIPIEERENLQNNDSAPFPITTAAMSGEILALASEALAALNSVAEGEQTPIDMGTFINWLNTSNEVRRYIRGQSVPEIEKSSLPNEPTQSVPSASSSNPDQLNNGTVISKPNDWTPNSVPFQNELNIDLLRRLLHNPQDIGKLNRLVAASENASASMRMKAGADGKLHGIATTTEASHLFHGNAQVVGQPPSVPKNPGKICMFFNTPKGCLKGASCKYLHNKSYQA